MELIYAFEQAENLIHKAQLQELELETSTKQLEEAIALAGEETAKCKAAKEVIKSLTTQVRESLAIQFMNGNLCVLAYM